MQASSTIGIVLVLSTLLCGCEARERPCSGVQTPAAWSARDVVLPEGDVVVCRATDRELSGRSSKPGRQLISETIDRISQGGWSYLRDPYYNEDGGSAALTRVVESRRQRLRLWVSDHSGTTRWTLSFASAAAVR